MKTEAYKLLEYFEYFCQISSKSILIILSCTVSKLVRFSKHSVDGDGDICHNFGTVCRQTLPQLGHCQF